jgi:thiamine-phosphate pyrophosphorylase
MSSDGKSKDSSLQLFRVIDENMNRLGEGLRVLEDIARMILNDTKLTQTLKTIRHELIRQDLTFNRQLLESRDSVKDVGTNIAVSGETGTRELSEILIANSRRVQESLRVLEEMAKAPGISLNSDKYKQARFDFYTIEKEIFFRLSRRDKAQKLHGLYVIIDTKSLKGHSPLEASQAVIKGGARVVQLRDKTSKKNDLLTIARKLRDLCSANNVLFIINDYLDITLACDADGLHIGQEDLPVAEARKLLPLDKIIGCSATSLEEAVRAEADGADYIGFGSIYPTETKEIKVAGIETLQKVRQTVKIPLVAIGGINRSNIKETVSAGADAAAVISAVLQADNIESATRELEGLIEK